MAFRKIHDTFWTDSDMEELTPEQKYFYLYLITNPSVNQIGLYEFSIRRASFETGYNKETIEKLLGQFQELEKIKISETTNEILIIKFWEHNKSTSPKVITHVNKLLEGVKDDSLIEYIYSIDTVCILDRNKKKKKKKKKIQEEERKTDGEVPTLEYCFDRFKNHWKLDEFNAKAEAEKFYNYWHDKDWRRGGKFIRVNSSIATWMQNYKKSNPEKPSYQPTYKEF